MLWSIHGVIGAAVLIGMGAVIAVVVSTWDPGWLPGIIANHIGWAPWVGLAVGLPGLVIEPTWRYLVHRWEVTPEVVYTRSGWFEREWRLVPISRIQTVDTTRGFLEQVLGLATLRIRTASYAGSSDIPGLRADVASWVAHGLAERASALRDDAT